MTAASHVLFQFDEDESEESGEDASQPKVYKPPKLSAVYYGEYYSMNVSLTLGLVDNNNVDDLRLILLAQKPLICVVFYRWR